MRASNQCLDLIRHFEGYVSIAKPCPAGLPTFGWGTTVLPDGSRVENGWETNPTEATQYLLHFVEHVCEPLAAEHFGIDYAQHEWDAIVSWVYNLRHEKIRRGEYSLPSLVREGLRGDGLAEWWIKYRNPGTSAEPGLYRRRLAELCLFNGFHWENACSANLISLESDWRDVLARAKRDGPLATAKPPPKPAPKPDPAPPPPAPKPEAVSVKEEPVTTLPGKPPGYTTKKPTQVAYKIDPEAGLKSLDESDRARGYLWQQIGRGVIRAGGLGMFGNIFAGGFQIIGQDAVLTEMMLALFVPAALAASALIGGYVIERYGDWKRAKGEREAVQGLY